MTVLTHELKASYAFVERNFYLTRRYWGWELAFLVYSVAGALSISLIGVEQGSVTLLLSLMIGAIFWNYLSVVFSWIAETIAVERWEGTLEYTMMAPVRRWTQLLGSCSLRDRLRARPHGGDPGRAYPVLPAARPVPGEPADRGGVHGPRLVQLRRDRDDGRHPAAAVRRARSPDVLRPPVLPAARQRRLLLGRHPAALDAGPVAPVARDVRPRWRPQGAHRRRADHRPCGRTSGRC